MVNTESITETGSTVSMSIIMSMPNTEVAVSMKNATRVANTLTDMSMASTSRTVSTLTSRNTNQRLVVASGARRDVTANRVVSGPRLADVLSGRNRGVSGMPVAGLRSMVASVQKVVTRDQRAGHRMGLVWVVDPVPVVRRR